MLYLRKRVLGSVCSGFSTRENAAERGRMFPLLCEKQTRGHYQLCGVQLGEAELRTVVDGIGWIIEVFHFPLGTSNMEQDRTPIIQS